MPFFSSANVANVGMSPENIAANVMEAVTIIGKEIACGWNNIKSIHLKTKKSISLPIYTNLIQPLPKRNFKNKAGDTFPDVGEPPNKNEDLDNCKFYWFSHIFLIPLRCKRNLWDEDVVCA